MAKETKQATVAARVTIEEKRALRRVAMHFDIGVGDVVYRYGVLRALRIDATLREIDSRKRERDQRAYDRSISGTSRD
jgi:hypothetical protein